jgi:hypothetical protein
MVGMIDGAAVTVKLYNLILLIIGFFLLSFFKFEILMGFIKILNVRQLVVFLGLRPNRIRRMFIK